jgi:hypothetical protein
MEGLAAAARMRSTIKRGYWSGRKYEKTHGTYLLKWCSYRSQAVKLRKMKAFTPILRLSFTGGIESGP